MNLLKRYNQFIRKHLENDFTIGLFYLWIIGFTILPIIFIFLVIITNNACN